MAEYFLVNFRVVYDCVWLSCPIEIISLARLRRIYSDLHANPQYCLMVEYFFILLSSLIEDSKSRRVDGTVIVNSLVPSEVDGVSNFN